MTDNSSGSLDYGILVHCHLRWDFVWQRPQHLISRLSQQHPVLFLEDPAPLPEGETQPRMQLTRVSDTLTVARPLLHPHTGDKARDAQTDIKNAVVGKQLLDDTYHSLGWKQMVHWFYTPLALRAADWYAPLAISYDCMDELANFKGAPAGLKEQEDELMRRADVVFTGGPSLYAARKDRHKNVHLFNSGVDVEHFQKALDPQTQIPQDIAALPHPILLYYGVIDERMGWDNLAAIADAHPEWNIVMVGPVVKIEESELLRRPNIHYTGQRGYEELPGYLKGCDIALVPFALSDATRYLSPTKTLEYFAARRPVVATPILDIVEHYADAARIGATPAAFVSACEAALVPEADNAARLERGAAHAQAQTWDSIVGRMQQLLDQAVQKNLNARTEATTGVGGEMATGHVRWYSGSRGVGVVDTDTGDEVMAFLPGSAQEDLGGVQEGDSVAVNPAGPAHAGSDERGANLFPLGLDKLMGGDKK